MQEIATAYPAIAQVVDITAAYGTPVTSEGRHLYALKISDNVSVDEDEPAMLSRARTTRGKSRRRSSLSEPPNG